MTNTVYVLIPKVFLCFYATFCCLCFETDSNSEILNKTFGKTLVKDKVVMKGKLNLHDIVFPQMFSQICVSS